MPSGSGLTARCSTSRGSSWFHVPYPTPASCHRRGHCCAPLDILGSKSHSPLVPPMSLVTSACRCGQGGHWGWWVAPQPHGECPGHPACIRWCTWPAESFEPSSRSPGRRPAPSSASPSAALPASSSLSPCSCLCPPVSQVRGGQGVCVWGGRLAEGKATGWRGPCSQQGSPCPGWSSLWPP